MTACENGRSCAPPATSRFSAAGLTASYFAMLQTLVDLRGGVHDRLIGLRAARSILPMLMKLWPHRCRLPTSPGSSSTARPCGSRASRRRRGRPTRRRRSCPSPAPDRSRRRRSAAAPRRASTARWPAKPPMRIFRPLRSATVLDLLAEPAAHLAAGVAGRQGVDVVASCRTRSSARCRRRDTSRRSACGC